MKHLLKTYQSRGIIIVAVGVMLLIALVFAAVKLTEQGYDDRGITSGSSRRTGSSGS